MAGNIALRTSIRGHDICCIIWSMAIRKLALLVCVVAVPFLGACNSARPTSYAQRLDTVAGDYERDLARVERILERVRPLVPPAPSTPTESELASSVRRADMALELAHDALLRARRETSGDQMRRVAAYSLLALEYANAADARAIGDANS